ncbi:MAG: hypothetical protein ACJ74P_02510, partial [Gaiellaceae bacterium]
EERIGRTESLFRGVNERIASTTRRFDSDDASFVCECDDPQCTERVRATLAEYEAVRADGARFLVASGHENNEVEEVRGRGTGFSLVEKVKPLVRQTAEQLNPRAQEA